VTAAAKSITPDDVARSITRTGLRLTRILQQINDGGAMAAVKASPQWPDGLLQILAKELEAWNEHV
jgi:hypothetical protein